MTHPKRRTLKAVLQTEHQGQWKMVAKCFPIESGKRLVALHQASGAQRHHNTEAIAGIDLEVVPWLLEHHVDLWIHQEAGAVYSIAPADIAAAPIADWDWRQRYYPHESHWTPHDGLWFTVPWIPAQFTYRLRAPRSGQLREPGPHCKTCGREISVLNKNYECGRCHVLRVGIKKDR